MAFFANNRMRQVTDYANRGRQLSQIDTLSLQESWVRVFGRWCSDPLDHAMRKEHEDIEAELSIRGAPVPYERVERETEAFMAVSSKLMKEARADPERWEQLREDLKDDLLQFAQEGDEVLEN